MTTLRHGWIFPLLGAPLAEGGVMSKCPPLAETQRPDEGTSGPIDGPTASASEIDAIGPVSRRTA